MKSILFRNALSLCTQFFKRLWPHIKEQRQKVFNYINYIGVKN